VGQVSQQLQGVQAPQDGTTRLANGGPVLLRPTGYRQISEREIRESGCLLEGAQRVVGRLLIPEHDNPGRLLRLVALGLSAEATRQVPSPIRDERQSRPDAVEEDSDNLECPSIDLVHELTGKSQDQHGRPVEEDNRDQGLPRAISRLSLEFYFDGQLSPIHLTPDSRVRDDQHEERLEEWKGFILD